jgi:hypothetical protein
MNKYKTIENKQFGKLKALYPLDTKENCHTKWMCKCSCGGYSFANASDLVLGKRKTCGCSNKPKDPVDNFEKHFEMKSPFECWNWNAHKLTSGYGHWQINHSKYNKHWLTHRFSYFSYKDNTLSDEDIVCHTCDNPSCVNPEHLFKGTQQDNIDDIINKGRGQKGSKVTNSKLNEDDVIEILRLLSEKKLKQTEIAKRFGVGDNIISNIKNNKAWKHVERGAF